MLISFAANCCELLSELYFYLGFTGRIDLISTGITGCELLSELYFYLGFTGKQLISTALALL